MRIGYDSVTVSDIPVDAGIVFAYVDGLYANVAAVKKRCPKAKIITITVLGTDGAAIADCETGDLTPASAAAWAKRHVAAGHTPCVYANESTMPALKAALSKEGLTYGNSGKVLLFLAKYDNVATLPAGYIAKQYRSTSSPNLDTSVVADHWPGIDADPAPAPTPAHHPDPVAALRALNPGVTGAFYVGQWIKVRSYATSHPPGGGWHKITGTNDGSWQALARLYP